jgi:predicted DCC family thiol-disulfide oxidoreductase YuxK
MDSEIPSSIVFFDGVCNLCNGFVDFLIRQDRHRHLRYASLQGETARKILGPETANQLASVTFYENGKTWSESDAVIKILSRLGALWFFTQTFWIVPKFLRDPIYRFVARNRYRWFGKRETCRLPSPDERKLFLN